jgi:hypothetical protein
MPQKCYQNLQLARGCELNDKKNSGAIIHKFSKWLQSHGTCHPLRDMSYLLCAKRQCSSLIGRDRKASHTASGLAGGNYRDPSVDMLFSLHILTVPSELRQTQELFGILLSGRKIFWSYDLYIYERVHRPRCYSQQSTIISVSPCIHP